MSTHRITRPARSRLASLARLGARVLASWLFATAWFELQGAQVVVGFPSTNLRLTREQRLRALEIRESLVLLLKLSGHSVATDAQMPWHRGTEVHPVERWWSVGSGTKAVFEILPKDAEIVVRVHLDRKGERVSVRWTDTRRDSAVLALRSVTVLARNEPAEAPKWPSLKGNPDFDALGTKDRLDRDYVGRLKHLERDLIAIDKNEERNASTLLRTAVEHAVHAAYFSRVQEHHCYVYFARARALLAWSRAVLPATAELRQVSQEIDLLARRFLFGWPVPSAIAPRLPELAILQIWESLEVGAGVIFPPIESLFEFLVRRETACSARSSDDALQRFVAFTNINEVEVALVANRRNTALSFQMAALADRAFGQMALPLRLDLMLKSLNCSEPAFGLALKTGQRLLSEPKLSLTDRIGSRWSEQRLIAHAGLELLFGMLWKIREDHAGPEYSLTLAPTIADLAGEWWDYYGRAALILRDRFTRLGHHSSVDYIDDLLARLGAWPLRANKYYPSADALATEAVRNWQMVYAQLAALQAEAPDSELWLSLSPGVRQRVLAAAGGTPDLRLQATLVAEWNAPSSPVTHATLARALAPLIASPDYLEPAPTRWQCLNRLAVDQARRARQGGEHVNAVAIMEAFLPHLENTDIAITWSYFDRLRAEGPEPAMDARCALQTSGFARDDCALDILRITAVRPWNAPKDILSPDGSTNSARDYLARAEHAFRRCEFRSVRTIAEQAFRHYTPSNVAHLQLLNALAGLLLEDTSSPAAWSTFETLLASALVPFAYAYNFAPGWVPVCDAIFANAPEWSRIKRKYQIDHIVRLSRAEVLTYLKSDFGELQEAARQAREASNAFAGSGPMPSWHVASLCVEHALHGRLLSDRTKGCTLPLSPEAARTLVDLISRSARANFKAYREAFFPLPVALAFHAHVSGARASNVARLMQEPALQQAWKLAGLSPIVSAIMGHPEVLSLWLQESWSDLERPVLTWFPMDRGTAAWPKLFGRAFARGADDVALTLALERVVTNKQIDWLAHYWSKTDDATVWIRANAGGAAAARTWLQSLAGFESDAARARARRTPLLPLPANVPPLHTFLNPHLVAGN